MPRPSGLCPCRLPCAELHSLPPMPGVALGGWGGRVYRVTRSALWRAPPYRGPPLPDTGLHPEGVLPVRPIPPCSVAPGMGGCYVSQVQLKGGVFADRHDMVGLPCVRGRRWRQGVINRLPAYVADPPGLPVPFPCLLTYSLPA